MQSETEDQERFLTINQWNPPIHLARERRGAVTVLKPVDPEINAIAIVMAEKPDAIDEEAEPTSDPLKTNNTQEPEVGNDVKNTFGVAGTGLGGPGGLGAPGASGRPLLSGGGFGIGRRKRRGIRRRQGIRRWDMEPEDTVPTPAWTPRFVSTAACPFA